LKERKRERVSGVHGRPWWIKKKEKKMGKVTQHQHQCKKGVKVGVNIEWGFFL
jgi:hypothetical protein